MIPTGFDIKCGPPLVVVGTFCALLLLVIAFTGFGIATRSGDPLNGYCYGVVDQRGGVHPSEEPAQVTQYGTIARTPEQVHYIVDPLYIIVDHECVCEQGLEPGVCHENTD